MDDLKRSVYSITIKYVDLDNDLEEIATSQNLLAELGQRITYSTAAQIHDLEKQGYVLVNNTFDGNGVAPIFDDSEATYMITFKHSHDLVTIDNLKYGCKLQDLQVKGTQVIHYIGAGNRTPRDIENTVTFNKILVYDRVTGKKIGSKGWAKTEQTYPMIGTPNILGYIPDKVCAGGETVNVDDPNREYTVTYKINEQTSPNVQVARVRYLDIDNHNNQVAVSDELIGSPFTRINYHTEKTINNLKKQGYLVVSNDFDGNGDIQFFDNCDKFTQTFIVTLRHNHLEIDAAHSHNGVDAAEYQKVFTRTINFTGAGDLTPKSIVQKVNWNRKLIIDAVNDKVIKTTTWQSENKDEAFPSIKVPVIENYHAEISVIPSDVADKDKVKDIVYKTNGRLIPVLNDGSELQINATLRFATDESDASKVASPITLPRIGEYEPAQSQIEISNPSMDKRVEYYLAHKYVSVNKDRPLSKINPGYYERSVTALVHYEGAGDKTPKDSVQIAHWNRTVTYDEITKKLIDDGKFNTDWTVDKQKFDEVVTPVIDGYIADMSVVSAHDVSQSDLMAVIKYVRVGNIIAVNEDGSPIPTIKSVPYINDPYDATKVLLTENVPQYEDYLTDQEAITVSDPVKDTKVIYRLKPNYVQVNSDHPFRGIDPTNYSFQVREKVHYQGAGNLTPVDRIQSARWQRNITVNAIDGQIVNNGMYDTDWSVDKASYDIIETPIIDGYHADKPLVSALKVDKNNHDTIVSYSANGRIIPVDVDGNKIQGAPTPLFITDPLDATKVMNEQPAPRLMSYIPKFSVVNVNNAGKNIYLTYYRFNQFRQQHENEQQSVHKIINIPTASQERSAVVNYIDIDSKDKIASSGILNGEVGQKINDLYNTADEINKLVKQGYTLVYNGFDDNGSAKYFETDQTDTVIYTVALKFNKKREEKADLKVVKENKPTVILPDLSSRKSQSSEVKETKKSRKRVNFFNWLKNHIQRKE